MYESTESMFSLLLLILSFFNQIADFLSTYFPNVAEETEMDAQKAHAKVRKR